MKTKCGRVSDSASECVLKVKKRQSNYNHGHNILRLFHAWSDSPFTASETKRDY